MQSALEASPLSPGAIFRHTWNLYRRHWLAWLILSAVAYLPYYLLVQVSSIAANYEPLTAWTYLAEAGRIFQALVITGMGAIFATDALRGGRPTLRYALDVMVTQRLGRVFVMWLLTGLAANLISSPLTLLALLNLLPYDQAIALADALPWIAGLALLLVAGAIVVTRQQHYLPAFLVVVFVVVFNLISANVTRQDQNLQNALVTFGQGAHMVLNALFLIMVPIVAIDPGPFWRTAARGWRIARQNLPLIFAAVFLIALAINFFGIVAQTVAYLLPGLLAPDQTTHLGPWQISTNYVNALIYYTPLNLIFVVAVFLPLQTIFATLIALDGSHPSEAEARENVTETGSDVTAVAEADQVNETGELAEPDDAKEADEIAYQPTPPLITYRDLYAIAGLMIVGTGLSYLSNAFLDASVNWLNQLIS